MTRVSDKEVAPGKNVRPREVSTRAGSVRILGGSKSANPTGGGNDEVMGENRQGVSPG